MDSLEDVPIESPIFDPTSIPVSDFISYCSRMSSTLAAIDRGHFSRYNRVVHGTGSCPGHSSGQDHHLHWIRWAPITIEPGEQLRVSVDGGIYYHEAYGRRWPCISVERDDPFFEFRWTIVLKCTLVRAESRCCATEKPVDPIVTANKKPAVWLPQCPWIFNYFPRPASTKPTVSTYWSESTQTEDRGWRNDVEEDFDDDELSEWEDITDDEDILDGGCFIDDDAEALDDDSGAFETVLSLPWYGMGDSAGDAAFLRLDNPPSETRRHSSASIPSTLSLWSREAVDLDKHSLMTTTVSSDRSALIGSATVPAQTPRLRVCVVGPALRHLSQSLILAGFKRYHPLLKESKISKAFTAIQAAEPSKHDDKVNSFIYLYRHRNQSFAIVKIGISATPEERFQKRPKCSLGHLDHVHSWEIRNHPMRIEKLVHTELANQRLLQACRSCKTQSKNTHRLPAITTHGEYFNCEVAEAMEVIGRIVRGNGSRAHVSKKEMETMAEGELVGAGSQPSEDEFTFRHVISEADF